MNISGLQKIAHKAGATRVSADVYDHVRAVGERYLEAIVKYAIIYCEHENKKIISEDHAIHGIEHVGFSGMYRASGDVKKCKTSNKRKLITRIKEYQGQHDCVTLAKATIAHQIKTLGDDYQPGFKWSKEAIINIHLALEYALYKLLFSALKVTINAKRVTMLGSDVDLTIDLITTNCKNLKL